MDENQARTVVRGLREGHTHAWQSLYDCYAPRVWHGVARLLGSQSADIGDVVQESLMAAARSIRTYDESKGTLWVWLWGITRLQVSLHFRKCQQQARLNRPEWLAASQGRLARWLEGNDSLAPDLLESAELQQLVRTVLIELPDDYAELLIAKYLEDEPILVIAERERTTETAVRSKLARAREAFRGIFKKLTGETMTDAEACHEHT